MCSGKGWSFSATIGDIIVTIMPQKLQMPIAEALISVGKILTLL